MNHVNLVVHCFLQLNEKGYAGIRVFISGFVVALMSIRELDIAQKTDIFNTA